MHVTSIVADIVHRPLADWLHCLRLWSSPLYTITPRDEVYGSNSFTRKKTESLGCQNIFSLYLPILIKIQICYGIDGQDAT